MQQSPLAQTQHFDLSNVGFPEGVQLTKLSTSGVTPAIHIDLGPTGHLEELHKLLPDFLRSVLGIFSSLGCTAPLRVTIAVRPEVWEDEAWSISKFEADQEKTRGEFIVQHCLHGTSHGQTSFPGLDATRPPLSASDYLAELRRLVEGEPQDSPRRHLYDHALRHWQNPEGLQEGLKAWEETIHKQQTRSHTTKKIVRKSPLSKAAGSSANKRKK